MTQRTFSALQQRVAVHAFGSTTLSDRSSQVQQRIKDGINRALHELLNAANMDQVRRNGSITLVSGLTEYAMPERCVALAAHTMWYSDNSDYEVQVVSEQDFVALGTKGTTSTGNPIAVSPLFYDPDISRWKLSVYPVPSSQQEGKTLNFFFYEHQNDMSADSDVPPIPENLHDYLVDGALVLEFPEQFTEDRLLFNVHAEKWQQGIKNAKRYKDLLKGRRSTLRDAPAPGRRANTLTDPGRIDWSSIG